MTLRLALLAVATLLLAGCGFHLRGHGQQGTTFAFHSLYLKTPTDTPFTTELRLNLELNRITLASSPAQADLILDIVSEANDRQIIALSGAGQVREYQLRYRVSLRAYDLHDNEWMPADEILLQRSMTFDDTQILAKEQEEAMVLRDMRSDVAQQVLRRLSRAKPRPLDPAPAP